MWSSAPTRASRRASISRRSTAANGFRLDGIDADDRSGCVGRGRGRRQRRRHRRPDRRGSGADPDDRYDAGESYVVFGTAAGFAASLDLAALDGTTASASTGSTAYDRSGISVAGAGDVNGDGIDDLIIGAPAPIRTAGTTPARATWCSARPRASRASLDLARARRRRTASASTGSTATTAAASRSPGRATSTATASTT